MIMIPIFQAIIIVTAITIIMMAIIIIILKELENSQANPLDLHSSPYLKAATS